MKFSLYEGQSESNCVLLMTDEATKVLKRKRERDISRRKDKNIKRWVVRVDDSTKNYDRGKSHGKGPWGRYNKQWYED